MRSPAGCLSRWIDYLTVNDVSTDNPSNYPELQPLKTTATEDEIIKAIEAVFSRRGGGWRVTEIDSDDSVIQAEIDTRWFQFTDDVTLWVDQHDSEHRLIQIRSRSRIGRGDFGKNARNIQTLLESLNAQLDKDID